LRPRAVIANAMVRTGIAILLVPDPVPLVDELVAIGLIGGGLGLHAYDYTHPPPTISDTRDRTPRGGGRTGSVRVSVSPFDFVNEDELFLNAVPYLR